MSGSLANPNVILQAGQGTTQPINLLAAGQQAQGLQSKRARNPAATAGATIKAGDRTGRAAVNWAGRHD